MSSPDGLNVLRHSTAHVLAQAVQDVYPKAKLGIGPPIENGFYYDFDVIPFRPEDLERIETRMGEIIKSGQTLSRRVFPSLDAAKAELADEPYKLELIDIKGDIDAGEIMEVGGGNWPYTTTSTLTPGRLVGLTCAGGRTCHRPGSSRP